MKTGLVALVLGLAVLGGCSDNKNRIAFDGHFYRTKVAKVDGERHVFTVRVRDVSQSLEGALEAGRHGGVSYCVEHYGSSDIEWVVGPDTPPEELRIVDDTLVFQGVCPQR